MESNNQPELSCQSVPAAKKLLRVTRKLFLEMSVPVQKKTQKYHEVMANGTQCELNREVPVGKLSKKPVYEPYLCEHPKQTYCELLWKPQTCVCILFALSHERSTLTRILN